MPLTLLFYHPSDRDGPDHGLLGEALVAEGCELDREDAHGYRQFHWHDRQSGAEATGDLGPLPVEEDHEHPPTSYAGWTALELALHIPLAVPHWHCVEAGKLVERLLERLPGVALLNTEDTDQPDAAEPGPGPLRRDALLACWEQLHAAQIESLEDLPRMQRLASVALWRYRREQELGQARHPELHWPAAMAMRWGRQAVSTAIQPSTGAWALPPVEILVLPGPEPRAVTTASLLERCAHEALEMAGALRLPAPVDADELDGLDGLPVDELAALTDADWTD